MTELSSAERNLLAVLAQADEPTEADRERVRGLVLQRVATATGIAAATYVAGSSVAASGGAAAVPAALASSTTASSAIASSGAVTVAATTAAVTWKSAVALKIAAAVVSVGVASGAGWYAVKSQPQSEPAVAAPQVVSLATTPSKADPAVAPAAIPAAQPALEAPKTTDAPAVVHRAAAADPKPNDHLSDEADLLKRVQRAINSGDTNAALSLLQQHATTYPSGVLVQERIGLRAITLCRAGQRDQGVGEATRFLKGNPSSPLAERVKSACELK